jgi:hypothetical protein
LEVSKEGLSQTTEIARFISSAELLSLLF